MTGANPSAAAGGAATPTKRGPYSKSAARKQQILDRVLSVFDQRGFDGTSLRAIADAIGVTHPTLVHYFHSREQLFLEVLREHDQRFLEHELGDDESFATLFARGADYSMRVPGLMALVNGMVARALESGNEHSRAYFVERYEWARSRMAMILAVGQTNGTVRTDVSVDEAAALFFAAADGLSIQWLLDRSVDMRAGLVLLERLLRPTGTED